MFDKRKGVYIPTSKKKATPPKKPKEIVIGAYAAPPTLTSEEDSILRGDDIISLPTNVPVEEMIEDEQFALVLKASMDTALEERAGRVASFIYDRL